MLCVEIEAQLGVGIDVEGAAIGQCQGFRTLGLGRELLLVQRDGGADVQGQHGTQHGCRRSQGKRRTTLDRRFYWQWQRFVPVLQFAQVGP